ncbi:hypothetical protein FNV43_RR19499 [Rhamnella rubrinervis]|uniref:Cytochrome P450 n=1 Tax=Rhamnella rubrinervis TaxID=2594499 RepID=A0A8K0GWB2_9ROSA|nr:hypothetical protein FNV43_RR19499 [Rhamnella rubrinervis]
MPHLALRSLAQKYGPILFLQLGEIPTVVVSSARLAKEALKTHDLALSSRPQIFSAKHLFYNCTDVVFSPYGAYWRQIRKICILELLSAKRVQSYSFVREQEVARLVRRVAESYPGTTNLSKMLALYSNDVLCRVAFGRDFSGGGEYDKHGFQKMLEENEIKTSANLSLFQSTFDQMVTEHLNPMREKEEHKDLVDVLLDVQKEGSLEMPLTMDNVKAIILDMFAAGTDTTFITLDWGMTELIMNPKVMEKHKLKSSIASSCSSVGPKRIYGTCNDRWIRYSAKTRIFVNAWAIGRDPETWENPETFEPERFWGSNIDFKGQDFELIPFGAGRRGCPAVTFGTATIELALAQLLHSFDWELPTGTRAKDLDMTEAFGITMHRIAHLIVLAKPRFA